MAWRVWGERLETADLDGTNKRVFQPFIPNKDMILIGVRAWVIVYNNPTFTDLFMKIYSDNANSPGELVATSTNLITKAEMITLANGVKEIPFLFDEFNMRATDRYHFILGAHGYTANWDTAGLAWRKGWPDPVYTTNIVTDFTSVGESPYTLYAIGSEI